MKEGLDIRDVNEKVNDIDKSVDIIKQNQNEDKKFIKDKINEESKNIQDNDETNEKSILGAITNLQSQPNISSQLTDYNTQLTRYNNQLTSIFNGLGDPNKGLQKVINNMNADIAAYNTSNIKNSSAIANMESTIQKTNIAYLDNIKDINEKINIVKSKIDNIDYEVMNKKIDDYTKKQLELTQSILTNINSNKTESDLFTNKLMARLKMDTMTNT